MTPAVISAFVTLAIAVAGFAVSYQNSRRLNERNDQLQRVNRQLAELYGPMLTLAGAIDISWQTFVTKRTPGGVVVDENGRLLVDKAEWMIWMQEVFMPLNRKLLDRILNGGDLLIEEKMPDVILEFSAHTSAWEATLARWKLGDDQEMTSVVNHPGRRLYRYAESSYRTLKGEQGRILAAKRSLAR